MILLIIKVSNGTLVAAAVFLLPRLGSEVMKVVASWTRELCMNISEGHALDVGDDFSLKPGSHEEVVKCLSNWSVLYIGTGKGLLLQELAKQGNYWFFVMYLY